MPRPPIDPDLAAKETLNQLSPSILRQIEKDESDDAYFYWARLAVGFWDRLVAHRLTPAVARRVNGVGLASIPEILPLLLRRPWLVEVVEPLNGERLFGDTTALGGFCDPKTGYWTLVGWRIVDGQRKVRSMSTAQPWTAEAKPDLDAADEDYQWRADGWHVTQPMTRDDYREHREWLQTAVRFAMLLGALLEADNTFLRTRDEAPKKERDVSTQGGSPSSAWLDHSLRRHRPRRGQAHRIQEVRAPTKTRATTKHRRTILGRGESARACPSPALRRTKPRTPLGNHQSPHFASLGVGPNPKRIIVGSA
jgi:hypothetical protein